MQHSSHRLNENIIRSARKQLITGVKIHSCYIYVHFISLLHKYISEDIIVTCKIIPK